MCLIPNLITAMHLIALQPLPPEPDPASLTDHLLALGWQALQFSPKVARVSLGANLGEALVMEVTASERLFGGRRALLERMFKPGRPLFSSRRAREATALAALAKLQLKVEAALQTPEQARLAADVAAGFEFGLGL